MNMMVRRGEFFRQADVARNLGSPFVAAVLEAGERQLARAPQTAQLVAEWPGDPASAALAMRFNAALHALARRRQLAPLSALYKGLHTDFDGAIGEALAMEDKFVARWMRDTPQTNEVGRAAAIAAALMVVRHQFGLPFALLEIGSSCGLNLNLASYRYDFGGAIAGAETSDIVIAPSWSGPIPVVAPIDVVSARGADVHPLDATDPLTQERLLAFIWADQPHRARRLEQALAFARQRPPHVEQARAGNWLGAQLALPQSAGVCRVVFHSMVAQYLSVEERGTVVNAIESAGATATPERPLALISFEWTPARVEVQLQLTCWPGGSTRTLATCHAYGDWIAWRPDPVPALYPSRG